METDIDRIHKVIDRHLFTIIRTFLNDKGVDISEFERLTGVIINKGMWIGAQGKKIAAETSDPRVVP
jgi:hypothetical protein